MRLPKFSSIAALTLAFGIFSFSTAHAQILAWDFDGINSNSNPTVNSTTTDINLNTSVLAFGSGEGGTGIANTFSVGSGTYYPALSDAVSGNAYFTFTVTPTAGQTVTVDSITGLVFNRGTNNATFTLESAIGGFGSGAGNILASQTLGQTYENAPIALTLTPSTPLVFSSATEFRIYDSGVSNWFESGFGNNNPGAGNGLVVTGSVVVPEPSTYALLLAGFLALVVISRRRVES